MKTIAYSFSLILYFLSGLSAIAQTTINGGTVSGVWDVAGSPYLIVGDIQIAMLDIKPGVKVICQGDYEIEVAGVVTAIGNINDSIIFTCADTASQWQGIFFNFSNLGSELAFCEIEKSGNSGIRIDQSKPSIHNCLISNNSGTMGGGIYVISGKSEFCQCTIKNNMVLTKLLAVASLMDRQVMEAVYMLKIL